MRKLFIYLLKYLGFLSVVLSVLLVIDFYDYDRISNEYLIHAIRTGDIEKNIIIGSSKVKWSIVDTLLSEKSTHLAEGGQFLYASVAVVTKLAERGLLKNKNIYIDLEESDEIKSGFGQWWYFSEAFVRYRYARFTDYPVSQWAAIFARIIKDITHFSVNSEKKFNWQPLEQSTSHLNVHVDADSVQEAARNFFTCNTPFSIPYKNALFRVHELFSLIEVQSKCNIFILIPPYPKSGCLSQYNHIFGENRVVDLSFPSLNPNNFHDNSHVNFSGAAMLTDRLNKAIKDRLK